MATDLLDNAARLARSISTTSARRRTTSSRAATGLNAEIVAQISEMKNEPEWMRDFRLKLARDLRIEADAQVGRRHRHRLPGHLLLPQADRSPGQDLGRRAGGHQGHVRQARHSRSGEEVPRRREGPVRERSRLRLAAGRPRASKGVLFTDTDTAVREHPDLVREYFGKIIPPDDNKFAALNSAVWSGGSFIYVPKGVKIEFPLQAYFRINAENMGQFERTLIIVDEGAEVHYVEGCTAPMYTHREPALGRGRDHRQEARPLPLHDDPELGEQHLQPRHQAGDGLRRCARWSGSTATSAAG